MKSFFLLTVLALVSAVSISAGDAGLKGKLLRELWENQEGGGLNELTADEFFPDYPTKADFVSSFEGQTDWSDSYGQRFRGFVHAPASGEYTFWVASDDQAVVFISENEDPAKKREIARNDSWTSKHEWEKYPSQKSKPVKLEAGKRYYIEALHKEAGGGDNIAVGWKLPDGAMERPIPGNRLEALPLPEIKKRPPPKPLPPQTIATEPGHHKRWFEFKVGDKDVRIPYLLYLPPDYASNPTPKPVLVFLHGVGERGRDLQGVYGWGPDGRILDTPGFKDKYPFIGIAPQAPVTHRWENPEMYKTVVAIIEHVLKEYRADKERVYLTGLSMGGRGTWEVALEAPHLFAAICPISSIEVRPEEAAQKLKNMNMWIVCGANDGGYTTGSTKMYETLKNVNALETKFSKHEGWGHDVWREYYPFAGDRMYAWFLTCKKGQKPAGAK